MLKYDISMILFLNVGHGISIRKCEHFGSVGSCLPWRQLALCSAGGRRRHWAHQGCSLHSCVLPWSQHWCLLGRLLFWGSAKLSKSWFSGTCSAEGGMTPWKMEPCKQELMDCAWWAFWCLSGGVLLWYWWEQPLAHREFEHSSLTFMVNYSYSVAVLEETEMPCSSETVVAIWDLECGSALLNWGFARSFKV